MMPSWNVGSLIFHARETLTCEICGERLRIEGELPGVTYCQVKPTLRPKCLKCVSHSALRHQSLYTEGKGQMGGDLSLKEKTFLAGEEITHQCRLETLSSGKTIKTFWHCRECTSIKCMAASRTSPLKNFSMFRMIWASSDFPGTTGKQLFMVLFLNLIFHLFSARNNWRKWTRKATVWSTIGKSIGPVSFPTETIVATEVFRFELIVPEKF